MTPKEFYEKGFDKKDVYWITSNVNLGDNWVNACVEFDIKDEWLISIEIPVDTVMEWISEIRKFVDSVINYSEISKD